MKICHSEALKLVKELEERRSALVAAEDRRSRIMYKEGEEKRAAKYDYVQTRRGIAELDGQIRRIRCALAAANCSVPVDDSGMTIAEALVYLAQLNREHAQLEDLSRYEKLTRRITANGVLEYTECLYDPEEAERDKNALYAKICKLQVAIDRANLTSEIEV